MCNHFKRFLSLFLVLVMFVSCVPVNAFATAEEEIVEALVEEIEETPEETPEENSEETPEEELVEALAVNAVAEVDGVPYETLAEAIEKAAAGQTVVLVADITASEIITINKGITLDGNGKKLTSTAARAINIETTGEVKISDLTVKAAERAFNVINQPANVTLTNVTATADNNAVMLATSAAGANLTVNGCDFTGLAVINVASAGSEVKINDTKITNVDANAAENYGAITVWNTAENASVTVSGGEIIVADDSKKAYNFAEGATITGVDEIGSIVAMIGDAGFETLSGAIKEAAAGETIKLVADITASEIITINKGITLDGNGKKLTSTAGRAINVSGANGATIRNLTIQAGGERAINVIQNATNLTVENVTASAANYVVNVASSAAGAVVTVKDSTLSGLNVVNVASAGADVKVMNTVLNCVDNNEAEGYSVLCLNKDAVGGKLAATNVTINISGAHSEDTTKGTNAAENGIVTIDGSAEEIAVDVAYIQYGDYYYGFTTVQEAVNFAKEGETVGLLRDVSLTEILTIDEGINLDGNGKKLTSTAARAINIETTGEVKISDLTVKAAERAFNVINQPANVTLTGVTATADNNAVMLATSAAGANLTVNGCDFTGLAVINVASAGSVVQITNTKITNVDANAAENYGAITVWSTAENASVTVSGGEIIVADDSKKAYNFAEGATITGVDDIGIIVAMVGDAGYETLAEAIQEAKTGETVKLVANVTLDKNTPVIAVGKTIDLNGYNLEADVAGTVKMNGGTFTTADQYKMMAPSGDFFYHTTDAVVTIGVDMTTTMDSGNIIVGVNGQTLPEQTVVVAEGATFTVPAGKTFNVRGHVEVKGTAIVEGTVTLGWETATVKAASGLNVVSAIEGYKVSYSDGTYSLAAVCAEHTWVDATCTEPKTCSVCGETEGSANGHSWVDADCHFPKTCSVCGETEGAPNEHTWEEATCTEPKTCSACDAVEGEALGHNWVDATYTIPKKCSGCGITEGTALGLPKPVVKANADPATGGAVLTWENDGEADYYIVYKATSSKGKYTALSTNPTESEFAVSVPVGKTYYYKVKAVCEGDASLNSAQSAAVKVVGKCAQPDVTVTVNASSGKPVLKWQKVSSAKKYTVYRATAIDGKYTSLKTVTGVSYTDTSAKVGTTYFYKVKALASSSTYNSVDSEIKSCLTVCGQPAVTISVNSTTGKPNLSWKAISGAVSYDIYRAGSADGEFVKLANQTEVSFADTTAAPDTDYWYKVNAVAADATLNSADNVAQSVHATLAKPVVTFTVDAVSGRPTLKWEAVEGAVEYKIYRSTSATKSYKEIAATAETEYVDETVSAGKAYYYKVMAIGANSKSAYSAYKKLTGKCAQPEITVTVNTSSGKPVVKWAKISGAAKYTVYRATAIDGKYTSLKTVTGTSYTDTSAKVGTTYFYKVKALASSSTYNSIDSEIKSCLTVCGQPAVTISVNSTTGKPSLSWKAISGAVSYDIYRAGSADGEFVKLANQTGVSFVDTTAAPDTDYWYKVNAVAADASLNSTDNAAQSVHATLAKPVVTFTVDAVSGRPTLKWNAVEGAVEYKIYRSTSATKSYKEIAATAETEYADGTASAGKVYYYKVMAIGTSSKSAYSAYKKLTGKCAQPEITVTVNTSSGKPVVKWSKISGAAKYTVYRATAIDGKYTSLKTVTGVSYTDTSAKVGTTYFYKVKAIASSAAYNSVDSEIKSCLTVCGQPAVTISINSTTGKPSLSWKAISGAVSYDIYRAESADGEFVKLANQTGVSFADTTAAPDTSYWYKVNAIAADATLNSADNASQSVHATLAKPVVTFTVDAVSGRPTLKWNAVEGAVEYKIYRSTSATKSYKEIAATAETEYADETAVAGKAYYYKVMAIGTNSKSAYSAYQKLTGKCAAPQITIELNNNGKIVISWAKVSDAVKYEVYRATAENGTYTKLATTTSNGYTDTKASARVAYYYKVKAIGSSASVSSLYSNIVSGQACAIVLNHSLPFEFESYYRGSLYSVMQVTNFSYTVTTNEDGTVNIRGVLTGKIKKYTGPDNLPYDNFWIHMQGYGKKAGAFCGFINQSTTSTFVFSNVDVGEHYITIAPNNS